MAFSKASNLSEQITNEVTERQKLESELKLLKEKSEQVELRFEENLPEDAAGTVEMPPTRLCKIGVQTTLPVEMPTLDDYVFLGWNTKPNGSGIEYTPGQSITPTEGLTLYAQWGLPKPMPKPTQEPTQEPEPTQVPTQEPEPTPPTMPPTTP